MAIDFTKKSWIIILFFVGLFMSSGIAKAQSCDIPVGLNATNLSNFGATLNWTFDNNVDHYRLRYQEINTGTWSFEHNVTGNSIDMQTILKGLIKKHNLRMVPTHANNLGSYIINYKL